MSATDQALARFAADLLVHQQPLGRHFEQVLQESLWDLYVRQHGPARDEFRSQNDDNGAKSAGNLRENCEKPPDFVESGKNA